MRGCLKVRVEEESFERVLKGRSVLRGAKNYRDISYRLEVISRIFKYMGTTSSRSQAL